MANPEWTDPIDWEDKTLDSTDFPEGIKSDDVLPSFDDCAEAFAAYQDKEGFGGHKIYAAADKALDLIRHRNLALALALDEASDRNIAYRKALWRIENRLQSLISFCEHGNTRAAETISKDALAIVRDMLGPDVTQPVEKVAG